MPNKYVAASRSTFPNNFFQYNLQYKSHENSEEQQCQYERATSDLSRKLQPNHHVSNFIHTWWTSAKSKRALEQSAKDEQQLRDQLVLDNYLESIDRRYKRLHKYDRMQQGQEKDRAVGVNESDSAATINEQNRRGKYHDPDIVTSAWQFLMQQEPSSAAEEQRKQEDAIYVLGLANLASKRLLQKHQLPIPISKQGQQTSVVIDVDIQASKKLDDLNAMKNQLQIEEQTGADINKYVATNTPKNLTGIEKETVRSLVASSLICIQLLKAMLTAYFSKVSTVYIKSKNYLLQSVKASGMVFTSMLKKMFHLILVNGGGKHSINVVSIFATSFLAGALSIARPFISKA